MNARAWGGVLLGALIFTAVIAASQVPWVPEPRGDALVRLSWRAVPPSVEDCHTPTEEELAGIPQHMRPEEICTGTALPFHLRFVVDGRVVVDERVVGAGARGDRPMYVFHEFRTEPGPHRIEVEFGPMGTPDSAGAVDERAYRLAREVVLEPLEIALVTRTSDGTLQLR